MTQDMPELLGCVSVIISRSEVESGDIAPALDTLKRILQSPELAASYFERVDIGFHGYDCDHRELFEIPEVRNYIYKLDDKFPFWLFFLSKNGFGLKCLLLCFLPPYLSKEAKSRIFPPEIGKIMSRRWVPAMVQLCDHVGFTEAQVNDLLDRVKAYVVG